MRRNFFGYFLFSIVVFPLALIVANMVSVKTAALAWAGRMGDHWETGRIEAFSDGVFAIALRLQDMPVEVDRRPRECVAA